MYKHKLCTYSTVFTLVEWKKRPDGLKSASNDFGSAVNSENVDTDQRGIF